MNTAFLLFSACKQWVSLRAELLTAVFLTVLTVVMLFTSTDKGTFLMYKAMDKVCSSWYKGTDQNAFQFVQSQGRGVFLSVQWLPNVSALNAVTWQFFRDMHHVTPFAFSAVFVLFCFRVVIL